MQKSLHHFFNFGECLLFRWQCVAGKVKPKLQCFCFPCALDNFSFVVSGFFILLSSAIYFKMPNKCGVVNCNGNYNDSNKCRVFKLPKDELEKQKWLNVLPPRENFVIDPSKFFICERHWPTETQMITIPGGHTRPRLPPSIFNVPRSCMPTPQPAPRKPKIEDQQLNFFLKKDTITSFSTFSPDKELLKKYKNVLITRSEDRFVCIFMDKDYTESFASIIVHNKPTLCSPLTFSAFKNGIVVPLGKILRPNNGLSSFSQFFEAVHAVLNYDPPVDSVIKKVVMTLQSAVAQETLDPAKSKKLNFLQRQLQLTCDKTFSVSDYCFAIESYPHCNYNQLRECLVLPSKRKLQSVISSVDIEHVLNKTFQKIKSDQQKHCLLLVDEVKIRPSVAYSGGFLSGKAKNEPTFKATSMLCVMLKCLHGGPSVMVSVTPVHNLKASYQFTVVKEAATLVEKSGGIVIGSITDNHKINQHYCTLFTRKANYEAVHPLDEERTWYLLYDSVHLLKCVRNNWITEKCQKLSIDKKTVGSFSDVKSLYEAEKDSILKSTPLTCASVSPSRLQLQNVQHVLAVFNDRVVAALRLQGASDTAAFIQQILDWWNTVNVSAKGQDIRMRDLNRSVQEEHSSSLQPFLELFLESESGHGPKRVQCLTHDTKRALVQTTEGLIAVCRFLFSVGFQYVLLRELQSDRIEGEFSVYRQSTGANAFMLAGDVFTAYKRRMARFAASFLESVEVDLAKQSNISHVCSGIDLEDATLAETCLSEVALSGAEENAAAYVAGWLEKKCENLCFAEDEPLLTSEVRDFIEEVSRGYLTVPHESTYQFVRSGLCFVKKGKSRACCRTKLIGILQIISSYYDFGFSSKHLLRRLANTLLHGIHNLEKDHQKNSALYQTSIKKARLAD